MSERKESGTAASGDARNGDSPFIVASAKARSITERAREITGCAEIVWMSTRCEGYVRIMLLIRASNSGLPSRSTCEKSSCLN